MKNSFMIWERVVRKKSSTSRTSGSIKVSCLGLGLLLPLVGVSFQEEEGDGGGGDGCLGRRWRRKMKGLEVGVEE